MSSLDKHVGAVRGKLALSTFLRVLAWAGIVWGATALLVVVVRRLWNLHFSGDWIWNKPAPMTRRELIVFWTGGSMSVVAALGYALWKRPSPRQAAVAIDEKLGLKEKFSTALYLRPSNDPFAAAAVRDAEQTAATVNLKNSFPVRLPASGVATILIAVVALIAFEFMPQLRAVEEVTANTKKPQRIPTHVAPELLVKQAIAEAESVPREVAENEHIKMATGELRRTLESNTAATPAAQQKAQDLLKEIAAVKERIADSKKFATMTKEMEMLKGMDGPSPDETGPVADAQRDLAKGDMEHAVEKLADTVNKFDKMTKEEQKKAADQMEKMAAAVAKNANDPNVKKDIEKELEKAGVDKKQAEDMANKMQQAANGDQQAQQQVQQMANKAAQQANQQGGLSQQQQQAVANAIKQAANQGQQKANAQASNQQMANTTQQLASAMKQAAQGQKQGQQGQGAQQQANAQQGQGKQGQQPGQGQQGQGGQGQQGQMAQGQQGQGQGQSAQQQMSAQVSQLQAMAKDSQAVAAAQQAQGQGQQGQGQGQGQQGQGQGQQAGQFGQGQQGQGQGQQGGQPGNQQGQGGGQNNAVAAGGLRPDPVAVPFATKQEYAPSQTNEDGKIIASSFVKAPSEKGESHAKMQKVIDADTKEDAGEVEPDRIPRSAQKAVKDYFDTLKEKSAK